ncbi:MAG: hypothetical protein VKI42_08650 [Synechococcaceae cyanobacterium]|nr:hypothetical protein [Synechococcaceae cyanobacterium]
MRPLATFQLLQPLPAGHLLFRAAMLLSFRWRGLEAEILSRLGVAPGVPLPVLRWIVARRERLLLRWHADLVDLRRLQLELTLSR